MKKYLTDNKSNLELTIENAQLEKENDLLRNENKLLKVAIVKVSDFIEKHNVPEPIKRGVREMIGSLKQKQAKHDIHRWPKTVVVKYFNNHCSLKFILTKR